MDASSLNDFIIDHKVLMKYVGAGGKVIIPDDIVEINDYAFFFCENLNGITISKSVTRIGTGAFYGCENLEVIEIPESITEIGAIAFENCKSLKNVKIPKSVTRIGTGAFSGCENLEMIEIPESITEIGPSAFENCKSLKNVKIPESVTRIGYNAFSGCENLEMIEIPESITEIGDSAFNNCKELADEQGLIIVNCILFAYFGKEKKVLVPEGVKEIGSRAFENCTSVNCIEIPTTVEKIGCGAFSGCKNLTKVDIPTSVTIIGSDVFEYCYKLADNQGMIIINKILFKYFGKDKNVVVPEGVEEIFSLAFDENRFIQKIILPHSLLRIGYGAFRSCKQLVSVKLKKGLKEISDSAFLGCDKLKDIKISPSVSFPNDLGCNEAFRFCKSLADENGFVIVNHILFDYFGRKKKVTVPDGVKTIQSRAFCGCNSITSIYIPKSVTEIRDYAFLSCSRLVEVVFSEGLLHVGEAAFQSCENLKEIVLPNSLIEIGEAAFDKGVLFLNKNDTKKCDKLVCNEYNIIKNIWNCYSPYIKGKKNDIEKFFKKRKIDPSLLEDYKAEGAIVSFELTSNAMKKEYIEPENIMSIIKEFPDLVVTCILTGDPGGEGVAVAVVFSAYGYPYITDGEFIGTDATDDEYTMCGFANLFDDYHNVTVWEEPHSGNEVELSVDYKYPFYEKWMELR